jgi:hypothetical protein
MHVHSLMMMVNKYLKPTVEGAWNMEMNVSDIIHKSSVKVYLII